MKLIVYHGQVPVYVEKFPSDCERTRKGSLHLLPRKKVTVTDGEWEHIQKKYAFALKYIRVISECKEERKVTKEMVLKKREEKLNEEKRKKEKRVEKKEESKPFFKKKKR